MDNTQSTTPISTNTSVQQPADISSYSPQELSQRVANFTQMQRQSGVSDLDTLNALKAKGITSNDGKLWSYQTPGSIPTQGVPTQTQTPGIDINNAQQNLQFQDTGYINGLGARTGEQQLQGAQHIASTFNQGGIDTSAGQGQVIQGIKNGNIGDIAHGVGKTLEGQGESTFGPIAGFLQTMFAPITAAVSPAIGALTQDVRTPEQQQTDAQAHPQIQQAKDAIASKFSELQQKHPDAVGLVGDILNTAMAAIGGENETGSKVANTQVGNPADITGAGRDALENISKVPAKVTGYNPAPETNYTPEQRALNKQAVNANKVINPQGIVTPDDVEKMSNVNQAGKSNATTKGNFNITKEDIMKPEVLANDPNNELTRELIDKGVVSPKNRPIENMSGVKGELQNNARNTDNFVNEPSNNVNMPYRDVVKDVNDSYEQFKKDNNIKEGSPEDNKALAIRDKFFEEINKEYDKLPVKNSGSTASARQAVKNFNKRMELELGNSIYDNTPEGKVQIKMAQNLRKIGNDSIQEAMNNSEKESIENNQFANQEKELGQRAKDFDSKQKFIDQMKKDGITERIQINQAGQKGIAQPEVKTTVGKSGLSTSSRSGAMTGDMRPEFHGKGYTTTPEEDLGDIWDRAHTGISSTKGDAFKASLQREARLHSLLNEMRTRINPKVIQSDMKQFLNSSKAYSGRRLASAALGIPGRAGAAIIETLGR